MKYSLMSLMIDECLKVEKPSFIHMHILDMLGYKGPVPSVDEMFDFFAEHKLPMKNGTMTYEDMVAFAKEKGFDGLDLMSFNLTVSGEEARKIHEKYGVVLSSYNVIVPFAGAMTEEEFDQMMVDAKEQIDNGAQAGAKHIMIVPAVYNLPEGMTMEKSVQNCIRALRELVKYGNAKGLTVSTETLESAEVAYCTCGEMHRILDNVEGLMYTHDTGNPIVGMEDPLAMYEEFKDKVSYVHFKEYGYVDCQDSKACRNGKKVYNVPFGEGLIDFKGHFAALKRDGYDGFINLEGFMQGEDRLKAVADSLDYFKKMEEEI